MSVTHSEFSLINHYFNSRSIQRSDVSIGIGDDAAVTNIPSGMQLVTTVDTLVEGVHFPHETSAYSVGFKSLAVSLSDLAAMGAESAWATLALTIPSVDEDWVQQFCDGFFNLLELHNTQLVGGDTTQGPLSVTVQLMGLVPDGKALRRNGATVGDLIYVSGTLGDAAMALQIKQKQLTFPNISTEALEELCKRLDQPTPRIELGLQLRDLASSAIDLSDGLAADLGHILAHSNVGATINKSKLPFSGIFSTLDASSDSLDLVLQGGDDYELCFTTCVENRQQIENITTQLNTRVTEIGIIESEKGLRLLSGDVCTELSPVGYQHFSKS